MQTVGFALLAVAFVASIFGFLQRRKGEKILATPFRRTGEISAAPAPGNVSCEGAVQVQAPAIAPCSGKPCLYYEIELVQEWTKSVATEEGVKQETGRSTINTARAGVVFYVNDGSGPIGVDPRQGMDVDLDTSFEQEQSMSYGDVQFGQFRAHVPPVEDGKTGRSVKVIERIVPADSRSMFVLGSLDQSRNIAKTSGLMGDLMASRKGRSALLGATKRNATIGFVAGALFMLPGGALAALGEPMSGDALGQKACAILDESGPGVPCTGKIYGDAGSDVTLTVTKAASFEITGAAPIGKKIPLMPRLDVKDPTGKALVKDADTMARIDLAPGIYTVNIRDSIPGSAKSFKGGFSYELSVKRLALTAPPALAPVAAALPVAPAPAVLPSSAANTVEPSAADAPTGKGAKGKGKGKGKKGGPKKTASTAKPTLAG